jgi:hypothetical protein
MDRTPTVLTVDWFLSVLPVKFCYNISIMPWSLPSGSVLFFSHHTILRYSYILTASLDEECRLL